VDRSHAGGSESLGEVATPTCTPCAARVRRSVASWPPVTASLRLPAICWSTAPEPCSHRGLRCRPGGPRTAAARHTARRGRGRPRCSALRCLASSMLGLPVTSSCTMFRPSTLVASAAHRPATSPQVRSTRMLPLNCKIRWASSRRDAVIDVLQLLPSTMLGQPRVGSWFGRPRPPRPPLGCQQCRVWLRCSGSTRPSTSSGWSPALCHRHHPPRSGPSVRLLAELELLLDVDADERRGEGEVGGAVDERVAVEEDRRGCGRRALLAL
jgi:hypothetical protein